MSRTGRQRLDAIPGAIERSEAFKARVKEAEGDAVLCADLMAEAITRKIDANGLETVRRDGTVLVTVEGVTAAHCMLAARDAYLRARGSNNAADGGRQ